ncbi:hypothetical protein QZH41_010705, partial [Actinostola sp. cb2023]
MPSHVTASRITHVLKENFENTTGLFVDQTRDSLDSTTEE